MEFENISKAICLNIDSDFNLRNANIRKISETILQQYPSIGETVVRTDYQVLQSLKDWKIITDENGKKRVDGIQWWDDYSNIKHQTFWKFNLSTLKNAVNALASLMVLELNLMHTNLGDLMMSLNIEPEYFNNEYAGAILCDEGKALPDFE